jgi:hypothetical protein
MRKATWIKRLSRKQADRAQEALRSEIAELQRGYDGYRSAFETLQAEATELRRSSDGYRGAYEVCCAQLASVRDERDRILRSLEKLRGDKGPLSSPPSLPGLRGRQLCFMHMGKTAGSSLQLALFEIMREAAIFHESLEHFDTSSAAELAINDLVIGQFMYQHVAKMRSDRFLLTFLRDPVERVISNYHFLRSKSPVANYSKRAIEAAQAFTLKEFLLCEDPKVRMVTENFQAKALAYDIRPEYHGSIVDLQRQARRNLSSFDFVGVVEYFDHSVLALSNAIGTKLAINKVNVTAARSMAPVASAEEIELIRNLNQADIAI